MIKFTLNNAPVSFKGSKELSLLTWLREEMDIVSAKDGCSGQGACGACLIELNGRPALSCRTSMEKLNGANIVTIEGFDPVLKNTLAKAFVKKGAVQCGFCTPGFLLRTKILLEQNISPTREEIKKAFSANLCRCTGYARIIDAVILAAESLRDKKQIELRDNAGVGHSRPKHDAYLTALGRRRFIDDMKFAGMLYGALRFSDHPRAKVLGIHTQKAQKLQGVVRVFTAKDIPGERITGTIQQDWPVMVQEGETTRYIGDVLAGVVAEDEKTARRACGLIEVEYEVLEPVTDPVEALTDKIKVHEKGNLLAITQFSRGGDADANDDSNGDANGDGDSDVNGDSDSDANGDGNGDSNLDKAFETSAFTVSAEYRTQLVEHAFLETEAAIAKPHGNDDILIYTQSQGIYEDRHAISRLLGIPKERVIASLVPCGGAFGGKEDLTVQGHAALFCYLLKRIVKLRLSREESIRMHVKRHPFIMKYKLGCDRKGKLTALFADIIGDTGAYASLGGEVLNRAAGHATGGYHVPVVDVVSRAVYTNNLPAGAMRGFGVNQVTFAMECMVDELCEKGGFDPWQFRFDNALEKGSMTATGQVLGDGVGLKETLLAVKEDYYNAKYAGIAIAIKNIGFGNGLVDESEAVIEIISDKKIVIHHGWTEMGQGVDTIAKQILCDVAGFGDIKSGAAGFDDIKSDAAELDDIKSNAAELDDIKIDVISSTDSEVIGGTTTASRGTFLLGNSLIMAANKLKTELAKCELKDLVGKKFKGRWFCDWTTRPGSNKPDSNISDSNISDSNKPGSNKLDSNMSDSNIPDSNMPYSNGSSNNIKTPLTHFAYGYAAQVVTLDEKGCVEKVIAAHDAGRVINPALFEGQIQGAVMMGLGYAFTEKLELDNGMPVSFKMAKLGLPRIRSMPEIIVKAVEVKDPVGPLGAKGVGEIGLVPTAPAAVNALFRFDKKRRYELPVGQKIK